MLQGGHGWNVDTDAVRDATGAHRAENECGVAKQMANRTLRSFCRLVKNCAVCKDCGLRWRWKRVNFRRRCSAPLGHHQAG